LASGAIETRTKAVSREPIWVSSRSFITSTLAVQPGQAASQPGSNMTCWTINWLRSPNSSASATGPCGPSKTYFFSTRTMGSRRRSALRAAIRRVSSFSRSSNRRLASSHSSRETISGRAILSLLA
jgi:hypothetical protein